MGVGDVAKERVENVTYPSAFLLCADAPVEDAVGPQLPQVVGASDELVPEERRAVLKGHRRYHSMCVEWVCDLLAADLKLRRDVLEERSLQVARYVPLKVIVAFWWLHEVPLERIYVTQRRVMPGLPPWLNGCRWWLTDGRRRTRHPQRRKTAANATSSLSCWPLLASQGQQECCWRSAECKGVVSKQRKREQESCQIRPHDSKGLI
mmetsp:Transcript_42774/g.106875  ORF Transcript_42774/g.106875 Transcript_42774/m.106875 type:complete len:207 (-) Transcript_42774:33-653(-)